jgi:hypothetical protein
LILYCSVFIIIYHSVFTLQKYTFFLNQSKLFVMKLYLCLTYDTLLRKYLDSVIHYNSVKGVCRGGCSRRGLLCQICNLTLIIIKICNLLCFIILNWVAISGVTGCMTTCP